MISGNCVINKGFKKVTQNLDKRSHSRLSPCLMPGTRRLGIGTWGTCGLTCAPELLGHTFDA